MTRRANLREREGASYGGSAEGIRDHYDIGNEFWPHILGPTMAYSCALFAHENECLDAAQQRKIDWHLNYAGVAQARSVLDVGCGWGSVLRPLCELSTVDRIVGITLSDAQAEYLKALQLPNTEVRVENWAVHAPASSYDAIISIGAFEHFAKPNETSAEKISVYRDFFQRCQRWLSPGGRMTLQTIAYGNMRREDATAFMNETIFPDSDLPYLHEIVAAVDGLFEIVALRNDRIDYAITFDRWSAHLRQHRELALAVIGAEKLADMERFFKMGSMGFLMGKQQLWRLALRPIVNSWTTTGAENWQVRATSLNI